MGNYNNLAVPIATSTVLIGRNILRDWPIDLAERLVRLQRLLLIIVVSLILRTD